MFDFIKEHNLFASVQNQVLLLIDFDQEQDRSTETKGVAQEITYGDEEMATTRHGKAIALLIDHTYSIPVRCVSRLAASADSLIDRKSCESAAESPKVLVHVPGRLVPQRSASNGGLQRSPGKSYCASLTPTDIAAGRTIRRIRVPTAHGVSTREQLLQPGKGVPDMSGTRLCARDGVPSRSDGQQQAGIDAHYPAVGRRTEGELLVSIEAKLTISQAIEFAREQADEDLWEDLLKYSEDNPSEFVASPRSQANPPSVFIRGLLENVGSDINPLRLIRRIKDGLEIPGLKPAIIKILQASNLQVSLLEGAGRILNGDAIALGGQLDRAQTGGFYAAGESKSQAPEPC